MAFITTITPLIQRIDNSSTHPLNDTNAQALIDLAFSLQLHRPRTFREPMYQTGRAKATKHHDAANAFVNVAGGLRDGERKRWQW